MKDNISIKKTLQESEESYLNVILKNADGIVIVDRNRVVKFMNPAAEVLFALSADDFVGELFDFPLVVNDVTELSLIRKGQNPGDVEIHVVETNWGGGKCLAGLSSGYLKPNADARSSAPCSKGLGRQL